ncbi:MAG: type II toxin-antitoxin system RelE/ParE family toxin [Phormidesmis sp.]
MPYKVELSKPARKFYRSANKALAKKIARAFEVLEQNPYQHRNIKPLSGNLCGQYRYRAGDYRIIYRINDERVEVTLKIKHRSDAY